MKLTSQKMTTAVVLVEMKWRATEKAEGQVIVKTVV